MNNIITTNNIHSIIPQSSHDPSPKGCFATAVDTCTQDNIKGSLESLPTWNAITTVFKIIAVLFLLKQVYAIVKAVIAAKPIDAVKAGIIGAVGTFFLFDLANTIGMLIGFKDVIEKIFKYFTNILNK